MISPKLQLQFAFQVLVNPNDNTAFFNACCAPRIGLGAKSQSVLLDAAARGETSCYAWYVDNVHCLTPMLLQKTIST